MNQLFTKYQYYNFEEGEFVNAKRMTYENVIQAIEEFPWAQQRHRFVVRLTSPSITIEGKNGDFLKIALYYNQKFVAYYINQKGDVYTKSFVDLESTYPYILRFFEQTTFATSDFKKEPTGFKHKKIHFITNDFIYKADVGAFWKVLFYNSAVEIIFTITFLIFIAVHSFVHKHIPLLGIGLIAITVTFFILGPINLLRNHYHYAKARIFIMSKGQDDFYFGKVNNLVKYNKNNIEKAVSAFKRGKSFYSYFSVVKIYMRDGYIIHIPEILLHYGDLSAKLTHVRQEQNIVLATDLYLSPKLP